MNSSANSPLASLSESALVERCRAGDPEAWNAVFDAHYDATSRFVFQLAPDFTREDVEEICQESFLSIVRNLGSFHGRSRLQTWIFRIAANKARDYRERRTAAKRGGGQVPLSLQAENPESGLLLDPPSAELPPDASMVNAEARNGVRQALEVLGDPCREIIELRYFGDLSYEEISASLDLKLKTVSSRLSKCLDRLGTLLQDLRHQEDWPEKSV
jgi:RNA polymerase sigma-70 factor (ECF subfamily)